MEPQRGLADALDNPEDLIAFLGADGFAEDATKKPYVVAQRCILVACLIRLLHRMARSNAVVRPDSSELRFVRLRTSGQWPPVVALTSDYQFSTSDVDYH